jgi:hypothetical protein
MRIRIGFLCDASFGCAQPTKQHQTHHENSSPNQLLRRHATSFGDRIVTPQEMAMAVPAGDRWRIRRNARVSLRSPIEGPSAFARCVRYQAARVTLARQRPT